MNVNEEIKGVTKAKLLDVVRVECSRQYCSADPLLSGEAPPTCTKDCIHPKSHLSGFCGVSAIPSPNFMVFRPLVC